MVDTPKLTIWDRAIGSVYAPYKSRAIQHRIAQQSFQMSARRDERGRKNSGGAALQPIGYGKPRTLSPHSRRIQIQSNRDMTENNPLGNALLSRWVDNVIGEGMTAKPKTSDKGFNEEVAHWWTEEYQADATGRFSNSEMQRIPAMSYCRDGDVGATMLKSGQLQIIESDYVRSPNRADDMYLGRGVEPDIVDGVKVNASGRPETYYIESLAGGEIKYAAVPARNFLFLANYDRANRTATRGTPLISVIRPLLDAIDATNEAVVMAHRIAASFGAMIKKDNPAQASSNLPTFGADPAAGEINRKYTMQPGMMEHLNPGESIEQIKPEHPTANYGDFISLQIRMAGVVLGMPLELALLDFSKTNYSSARASLEQSYRSFRVQQRRFADQWATKWYRWRVSKAVKSGVFGGGVPEDFQRHTWMAQPWPYLDPVKDAQGIMAMIDAGPTTLSDELAKRGYSFGDWIDMKREEIDRAAEAGVPLLHSNVSREASGPKVAQSAASTESENPEEPEQPDDDNDNEEENGAEGDQ